jgi:hypothetical protein
MPELLLELGDELDAGQGGAAQLEEVVVHPHPFDPQHAFPDGGDAALEVVGILQRFTFVQRLAEGQPLGERRVSSPLRGIRWSP